MCPSSSSLKILSLPVANLRHKKEVPSEAAKSAAESIKQAAAALVELSKGTGEPLDLVAAEARIRDIQLKSAQLASEQTQ